MVAKLNGGRWEGRKPSGEEVTLGRMIALRATNLSYEKIAAALNAECLNRRKAAKFYVSSVQDVLKAQADR